MVKQTEVNTLIDTKTIALIKGNLLSETCLCFVHVVVVFNKLINNKAAVVV